MPSPVPLIPLEVGGSNYPMYSVGEYLASPTEDTWFTPGNMRPVIGTFDLDPGTVEQQLRSMYANGQRKIALVLWCDDFTPDARIRDIPVYGHVVNSKLGRLLPTHEANLRRILGLLREVGYDELSFRFATQGSADPRSWTSWDEGRYGNTWSFVSTTRAIIEEVLGPGPVQVAYDLDVELGGIDDGQAWNNAPR